MQNEGRLEKDQYYMKIAIELAKHGIGKVNPNPLVGSVIVKEDQIIGKGYHERYGGLHAEREAIKDYYNKEYDSNLSIDGATMYVSLEPCCHYGKTPPCTEAIIENKIKRVVVASLDPNPLVAGNGVKLLEKSGIKVDVGILKDEADRQNRIFRNYIKNKKPLVTMKYAMTMDGKIATYTGESKWITDSDARKMVHLSRLKNMAIMVGAGTVLTDEPMLNCRLDEFNGFDEIKKEYGISDIRNPIRIIVDSNMRTPIDSKIISSARDISTIILTISNDKEKINLYESKGCKVIVTNKKSYKILTEDKYQLEKYGVDLNQAMDILGDCGIDSILLEGGSQLNYSAFESGIVDRIQAYIAPKIFGGKKAKSPVGGIGVEFPNQAFMIENIEINKIGKDILLEGDLVKCSQE